MTKFASLILPALLAASGLAAPLAFVPAAAAVDNQDPARFVETLSGEAFGTLRSGSRTATRAQFRTLLTQYFAVDAIGNRLIAGLAPTPAQRAQYKALFPNYIIGTYADRLFDYSRATVKVVRTAPAGGGVDVTTQVTQPGQSPVVAIWSVAQAGGGYKVVNLKVAGINLAIAQAADFRAIVQRQGFDALLAQMKSRS